MEELSGRTHIPYETDVIIDFYGLGPATVNVRGEMIWRIEKMQVVIECPSEKSLAWSDNQHMIAGNPLEFQKGLR
jgi:hypothetical protein